MNLPILALTGAAVLAVTPAWSGESTPAEKEATRQLNLEAAKAARPAPQMAANHASTAPMVTAAPSEIVVSGTLSTIANPPSKIAIANVLDNSGKTIGVVQRVQVSPEGKPTKVSVALNGAKAQVVTLDAGSLNYDAHKNEITAYGSIPAAG